MLLMDESHSFSDMEVVEKVLSVAHIIYAQCEQVKCCKHQCRRLVYRVHILLRPVEVLRAQPPKQISSQVEETLQQLLETLEKAQELVKKYSQTNWLQKFLKAGDVVEGFGRVNERLGDAAQGLSLLLQAEHKQSFLETFQRDTCSREDSQDTKDDKALWEELLTRSAETKDAVDNVHKDVRHVGTKVEDVGSRVEEVRQMMQKLQDAVMKKDNAVPREEITEIRMEDLTKTSWTFLMESKSHTLYKGEFYKYPVAIKVFKNPVITSTEKVREIFRKEIETMKKFESPNILRMYGICIDERGSSPCFSIVMEYCEKGTLRDVLTRKPQLPWETRIRMALDAARGLYRLHQTGEKSKLHGCINSTKFLVAKGYCVKLSGFELSKTESSIKRSCRKKLMDVPASAYISPLGLASLSHKYDVPSEIYSFGIVLWEIATSKIPFEGCSSQEIYQKVYEQRYQAPVGEDCPSHLRDVINQCRAFEPSQRPSAEEIVDSLIAIYGKINTAS
ncbi:mixed lineage kinase domain-like protein isoform X1 [Gopherus evgoodei]|uniref:mixed lineage kinase domain-like protein isoform X1 n=2 Tax=Gopherus evgoodei TaxID=1825980 RepID=UPI0011CFF66E|nr:mixed lineage kinase domain-like protein isoform X1 [Gopherus evgoodei]